MSTRLITLLLVSMACAAFYSHANPNDREVNESLDEAFLLFLLQWDDPQESESNATDMQFLDKLLTDEIPPREGTSDEH